MKRPYLPHKRYRLKNLQPPSEEPAYLSMDPHAGVALEPECHFCIVCGGMFRQKVGFLGDVSALCCALCCALAPNVALLQLRNYHQEVPGVTHLLGPCDLAAIATFLHWEHWICQPKVVH